MLKIGLTGGIGSGKSTVAEIFRVFGIPVYNSDLAARRIMQGDPDVVIKIKSIFGSAAYSDDGLLDRGHLSKLVFNDAALLSKLNGIVHPAVGRDFDAWSQHNNKAPYVIKEAALVFEAGINRSLDYVILVTAPVNVRVTRVMNRDGTTEEEVRARIANQWPESDKAVLSDFIIVNDGERFLLRQVEEVHNFLLNQAGERFK